jgi:hypothetical protein
LVPPGLLAVGEKGVFFQGATEKKKKKSTMYVRTLFGHWPGLNIELLYTYDERRDFFIAFLSSPYRETPKNAKKKIGKGEKN